MWTRPAAGLVVQDLNVSWPDNRYAVIAVRKDAVYVSGLIALCIGLFFWHLDMLKLWDIDEGMHAVIAQNMIRSGDWVTPVFNGAAFLDKPPLFNWLCAASFGIFGFSEFAARLPVAALGLACVLTTFLLGRKMFNSETGLLGAVVLATSLEFIVLSRQVQYDIPFTFFTTLSLYFFCSAYVDHYCRARNVQLFYVAVAAAVLTKGPLGLVLPGLVVILFLVSQRRLSFLGELISPVGIGVFLLLTLPWYLLMERANPGYLDYFFWSQHFANVVGGFSDVGARHPRPIYYYIPILVAGMFPWCLLLPGAIGNVLKRRGDMPALLLIWLVAIFVLFSLSSSKLSTYILPLMPAAALLVGRQILDLVPTPAPAQRKRLLFAVAMATLLASILAVYVVYFDPWSFWQEERGLRWREVETFAVFLAAMLLALFILMWRRKFAHGVVFMTLMAPAAAFTVLFGLAPDAEPYNSAAKIGARYEQLLAQGEKMVFSTRMLDSALFYSGREALVLEDEQQLNRYLNNEEQVFVLLSQVSKTASSTFDGDYHVIYSNGNKAIVSNRAPESVTASSNAPRD